MISRDILLQVLARLVALEGKIDKLQELYTNGVKKVRREIAGLREAIRP
jgi:hypothetical protein